MEPTARKQKWPPAEATTTIGTHHALRKWNCVNQILNCAIARCFSFCFQRICREITYLGVSREVPTYKIALKRKLTRMHAQFRAFPLKLAGNL